MHPPPATESAHVALPRSGRAKELAIYVDRWCEIEADAAAITRGFSASGGSSSDTLLLGGSTSAVPAVAVEEASPGKPTNGVAVDIASELIECQKIEYLLTEVGALAGALSLPNATAANGVAMVQQKLAFALSSFRSAMAFCARGLRILFRDISEVERSLLHDMPPTSPQRPQ